MLTYTFSTREKVMLSIFAFVCVGIVWYRFVFVGIQDEISRIDTEIATTQEQLINVQSHASQIASMKAAIEEFEKQGLEPMKVPAYDNTKSLMAYLNNVLSSTFNYNISFGNPVMGEDGIVRRSGTITYGSPSYDDARATLTAIAKGPYPCWVRSVAINDRSAGTNAAAPVSTSFEVVFFENPNGATDLESEEDEIPEGNDWSEFINETSTKKN